MRLLSKSEFAQHPATSCPSAARNTGPIPSNASGWSLSGGLRISLLPYLGEGSVRQLETIPFSKITSAFT